MINPSVVCPVLEVKMRTAVYIRLLQINDRLKTFRTHKLTWRNDIKIDTKSK
jgi:hypothetical protein